MSERSAGHFDGVLFSRKEVVWWKNAVVLIEVVSPRDSRRAVPLAATVSDRITKSDCEKHDDPEFTLEDSGSFLFGSQTHLPLQKLSRFTIPTAVEFDPSRL